MLYCVFKGEALFSEGSSGRGGVVYPFVCALSVQWGRREGETGKQGNEKRNRGLRAAHEGNSWGGNGPARNSEAMVADRWVVSQLKDWPLKRFCRG